MLEPGVKFCAMCGRLVMGGMPVPAAYPGMSASPGVGASASMMLPQGMGAPAPQLPLGFPAAPPQAGMAPGAGKTVAAHLKATARRAASHQTVFEVYEYEMWRLARIVVDNTSVVLEAGQLHYWLGQFQMQARSPSLGGIARSFLTKERAVRPVCTGRGEIWLEPTFGEIEILELNGTESWILDKGCYLASDATVQLGVY
ncbi:MAG: AIM24 family protein, partial [Bryobacteraceae bacterium]